MVRRRLTNDDWGLDSNCFVCEATNAMGLRLELWSDESTGVVDTNFTLGSAHSGAPTLVHGGVLLAVLDEVQAWAVIALEHSWAVTAKTSATFAQPVWIDRPYRAVARVDERQGDRVITSGWIEADDGTRCVESSATFVAIGEAMAKSVISGDLPDEHRGYLSDG